MRKWLPVLVVVIAVIGGKFIYNALHQVDDRTQIQASLAEAIKAGKEGRPGSVIDKLSDNFKVNEEHASLRQIAEFVKNNHPDVEVKNAEPVISGDTAIMKSDVDVRLSILNIGAITFRNATIDFKKETQMEWLIFPTSKWHLAAVHVAPEDMPPIPFP